MREHDIEAFAQLLGDVMSVYGRSASPTLVEIWWEALRGRDFEDVRRALSLHCQDPDRGQYAPKPADVIRLLGGDSADRSLQAWTKVERAIRCVGHWQSVVFDDPRIHAVIDDMGGWVRLCSVTEDELPFRANEFRNRYRGYALREPDNYPPVLIGAAQAANERNGYQSADPLLIGDRRAALGVYRQARPREKGLVPLSAALRALPERDEEVIER